MKGYSYVVSRDYGFAPNPFGTFCTLATCKPDIRKTAKVNDFIFGISSKNKSNKLIFAMKVSEKLTYNEYWTDFRFQYKKPVLNGSLIQTFGDNIYFYQEEIEKWKQLDSHHSLENGMENEKNLNNDTKSNAVLISNYYFYFGKNQINLPDNLKQEIIIGRKHKIISLELCNELWNWLEKSYQNGLSGMPSNFEKGFERYSG